MKNYNELKFLKEIFLWGIAGIMLLALSSVILRGGLFFELLFGEVLVVIIFVVVSFFVFNIMERIWNHKHAWIIITLVWVIELVSAYFGLKIILRCIDIPLIDAFLSYLIILIITCPGLFLKRKKTGYFIMCSICASFCFITDLIDEYLSYASILSVLKGLIININEILTVEKIVRMLVLVLLIIILSVVLYKKEEIVNVKRIKLKLLMVVALVGVLLSANIMLKKDKSFADIYAKNLYSVIQDYGRNIKLSNYSYNKDEDIPTICFEGDLVGITNKNEKIVRMTYESKKESFDVYSTIKWQGTSSLGYPKKNYTIKLFSDATCGNKFKVDFEGWGEQNKFCLKANFIDFTQARNVVSAKIGGDIAESIWPVDAPNNGCIDGFPVRVVINGLYQGLYTLNIPKDGWLFGMDEENANHIVWCAERNNNGNLVSDEILACEFRGIAQGNESDWSLEFPGEQNAHNLSALNRVITFVKDSSDEEFVEEFEDHFNKEAVLNYYIFQYFSAGIDGLAKNMLLVTYDGKIWYPSLYDLDSTWGLYFNGSKLMDYDIKCPDEYQDTNSLLWQRVEKHFSKELYLQYKKLRLDELSVKNVVNEFEIFTEQIDTELYEEEKMIWPEIPSKDITSIEQIKDFVEKRAEYVDEIFETKFQ